MGEKTLEEEVAEIRTQRLRYWQIEQLAIVEDKLSYLKARYDEQVLELETKKTQIGNQEFIPFDEGQACQKYN